MIDSVLRRLGEILVDDERRQRFTGGIGRWLKRIGWCLVVFGLAFSIGGIAILRMVGENNVTTAFALYLPRVLIGLPLLLVTPVAVLLHWRLSPILIGACLAFLSWGMGWNWGIQPKPVPSISGNTLTVVTYNRGQHMNQSLQPFKEFTTPDVLVLQEAPHRASRYANAPEYQEFVATTDAGEFTLLSRYPILSTELLEIPSGETKMHPAMRVEIDFAGIPVAIYSVHFMSPRGTLSSYRGGAFLYGIVGLPGTPWAEGRRRNQEFWDARIAQAAELIRIVKEDPLPALVVGDFNAPAGGFIHGLILDDFEDAHLAAGAGFGYTFPGTTRNPLSLGGPWMRIDYLFAEKQYWTTEWCITEADRPSQHRAVAAQFRLK